MILSVGYAIRFQSAGIGNHILTYTVHFAPECPGAVARQTAVPAVEVTVFNPWDEVIYRSNNGYRHSFDGTMNGKTVAPGTYAYTIRYESKRPLLRATLVILH